MPKLSAGVETDPDQRATGFVDGLRRGCIEGWAWDPARPDHALTVELLLDTHPVGEARADLPRPDLISAGIGNGEHAFRLSLPDPAPACGTRITVRVKGGGTLAASVADLLSPDIEPEEGASTRDGIDLKRFGVRDAQLNGWYNRQTWELAPGFDAGPGLTVADIGCGDGGAITFCAELGAAVILADIDAARLHALDGYLTALELAPVGAHEAAAEALPIESARCDRVICMEVLEHVDDPDRAMAELVRIGKPGARYLLTVPDPFMERMQQPVAHPDYFRKPNHVRIFEHAAFAALVEGAGLIIESRSAVGGFWAFWGLFFWQSRIGMHDAIEDPVLRNWAHTWAGLLKTPEGRRIKLQLDNVLPKSQVIVARKPC